jgi:ribose transport system substrate-binding protein
MRRRQGLLVAAAWLTACELAAQPAPPKRDLRIAMIAKSSANFVFIAARTGAEEAARAQSAKHGVKIEVSWLTPPQEDAAVQAERIAQAVREGASAILISCSDAARLTPAIDEAVAKGVPVMTFDSDAAASKRFAFFGADDADLGEKVMADLADLLGGKGKIAILAGNPDAPNLKARAAAVKAAAARHREIEVVEVVNHVETPQDAAQAVLRVNAARPDLAGWAMVGGWPLFRSSQTPNLYADLQRRRQKIVAVDALPDQLNYVERDLVPLLWAQPMYDWGAVGVNSIVDKLLLGKVVPERMRMELVRVTKGNLGSWSRRLKSWGFTGIPPAYLERP